MFKEQKGSTTVIIVAVIVVALIIGSLVYVMSSDEESTDNTENTSSQAQPDTQEAETTDDESDDTQYEEINLEAIGGQTGEGVAIRSIDDPTFTHELYIQTTDPMSGKFYEGWLVGDSVVSTGKLEKNPEGVWYLKFTSSDDLSNHSKVVVTEETESDGLDGKPETHIFEGSF